MNCDEIFELLGPYHSESWGVKPSRFKFIRWNQYIVIELGLILVYLRCNCLALMLKFLYIDIGVEVCLFVVKFMPKNK
jgi:hypothetical protein